MKANSKSAGTTRSLTSHHSVKVLVVDDEPTIRELLTMMLKLRGHTVYSAEDGAQALAMARALDHGDVELLITDLSMPDMSGGELAAEMQLVRPEIKVIFASGHAADEIAATGRDFPEAICISKPFKPDVMDNAIRALFVPAPMPC